MSKNNMGQRQQACCETCIHAKRICLECDASGLVKDHRYCNNLRPAEYKATEPEPCDTCPEADDCDNNFPGKVLDECKGEPTILPDTGKKSELIAVYEAAKELLYAMNSPSLVQFEHWEKVWDEYQVLDGAIDAYEESLKKPSPSAKPELDYWKERLEEHRDVCLKYRDIKHPSCDDNCPVYKLVGECCFVTMPHMWNPAIPSPPEPEVLKPCPFCGNEAELYSQPTTDGQEITLWEVQCYGCAARTKSWQHKEEAVTHWNIRP